MEEKQLNEKLEQQEVILRHLWDELPGRYKELSERAFDNMVDLGKQLAKAKIENDENKVLQTKVSLDHATTAFLSAMISGILALEDPVKETALSLAFRAISPVISVVFDLLR